MKEDAHIEELRRQINPRKEPDREFFQNLQNKTSQMSYESSKLAVFLELINTVYLQKYKNRIADAEKEKAEINADMHDYHAAEYKRVLELNAKIEKQTKWMRQYDLLLNETYFARLDVADTKEGYNSYYIGKNGLEGLNILDWRSKMGQFYYRKNLTSISVNEYDYKLVLRRSLSVKNGNFLGYVDENILINNYLAVLSRIKQQTDESDEGALSQEPFEFEIDESLIYDPMLRNIVESRKDKQGMTDIIKTIQEAQYDVITLPEKDQFVLQGVAGAGKTVVLLHRLSFIMFNDENVDPSNVMIVTPSNSYNDFIDELSAVLEIEKVRTSTLDDYFTSVLKSLDVDLSDKMDLSVKIKESYLKAVYSKRMGAEIEGKIYSTYNKISAVFARSRDAGLIQKMLSGCKEILAAYDEISGGSKRVADCALGDNEAKNGVSRRTKRFGNLIDSVKDVRSFISGELEDFLSNHGKNGYIDFTERFVAFSKAVSYLESDAAKILGETVSDLMKLRSDLLVEKIDNDYNKKKIKDNPSRYAEEQKRMEGLLDATGKTIGMVQKMIEDMAGIRYFALGMKKVKEMDGIGKCEKPSDLLMYFYNEIIVPKKQANGLPADACIKTDPYIMTLILSKLGYNLAPKYSYMLIDEGQDISESEYELLKAINDHAVFNVYGDLKQNITPSRGLSSWDPLGYKVYNLDINYRNTNEIVNYVATSLGIKMNPAGISGSFVRAISPTDINSFFSGKTGLKAIICSEKNIEALIDGSYSLLRDTGTVSKDKINLMTVFESKGLEFGSVAVYDEDLTPNEKYIAYTRALDNLVTVVI